MFPGRAFSSESETLASSDQRAQGLPLLSPVPTPGPLGSVLGEYSTAPALPLCLYVCASRPHYGVWKRRASSNATPSVPGGVSAARGWLEGGGRGGVWRGSRGKVGIEGLGAHLVTVRLGVREEAKQRLPPSVRTNKQKTFRSSPPPPHHHHALYYADLCLKV